MEIFPTSTLSFNDLLHGYQLEAYGLAAIAESANFSEIMKRFRDYEKTLKDTHQQSLKLVSKLCRPTGIIDATTESPELREIFYTAHIAACCELFNGSRIPSQYLNRSNIATWVNQVLSPYSDSGDAETEKISSRLHSMDAVRTMSIIRSMGLVTRTADSIHQLSLGAGPATKDIRSIHLTPSASLRTANSLLSQDHRGHQLSLDMQENKPGDIIVIDSDPQREEQYRLLNESCTYNLLALNSDTNKTLKNLPAIMKQHDMPPRNLVIALRIDHRMIPDTQEFLGLIATSIDSSADMIVTMGSGFNIDDFRGRIRTTQSLFSSLKRAGLNPVLIKLHGGGSLEQQRNTPSFGLSSITSYEILFCKLKKKKLDKAFSSNIPTDNK